MNSTTERPQTDVTVEILGQCMTIKCPQHKVPALKESAQLANQKMKEIKDSGNAISSERIAMMAALNLAYELLEHRDNNHTKIQDLSHFISALEKKILKSVTPTE